MEGTFRLRCDSCQEVPSITGDLSRKCFRGIVTAPKGMAFIIRHYLGLEDGSVAQVLAVQA